MWFSILNNIIHELKNVVYIFLMAIKNLLRKLIIHFLDFLFLMVSIIFSTYNYNIGNYLLYSYKFRTLY